MLLSKTIPLNQTPRPATIGTISFGALSSHRYEGGVILKIQVSSSQSLTWTRETYKMESGKENHGMDSDRNSDYSDCIIRKLDCQRAGRGKRKD